MTGPLDPALADALSALAAGQAHDQVLGELEARADATGMAMADRAAGSFVSLVVRAVGARRVVELGAGIGDLTWWLTGAVGDDGEVVAFTDQADVLEPMLRRAGRFDRVKLRAVDHPTASSPDHVATVAGDIDALVVREVTPRLAETFTPVSERVRTGGLLLVGAVLTDGAPAGRAGSVVRAAVEDPELWASVVPLGDGWLLALRARSDPSGAATDRLW